MLRHPWARRVLEERGTGGPACLAYIESLLATLHEGGFSIELAHHALHVLGSRIFGFTQDLFEEPGPAIPHPIRRSCCERSRHTRESLSWPWRPVTRASWGRATTMSSSRSVSTSPSTGWSAFAPASEGIPLRKSGSGGRIRTYDQAVNSRPLYH